MSVTCESKSVAQSYIVCSFLFLVTLLVGGRFRLIRLALLLVQSLPALTKDLSNLACPDVRHGFVNGVCRTRSGGRTKRDTRVLFADIFALLIGKEHVSRKPALGRIGIWERKGVSRGVRSALPRERERNGRQYPSCASRHRGSWSCDLRPSLSPL